MPSASADYRSSQADLMRSKRDSARIVVIPKCKDKRRRKRLEKNDAAWLRFYCHELFWYDFTPQQLEIINAIAKAIRYGGDVGLAASRGEGKTKIAERVLLKYTLQGLLKFSVLFAATGSKAVDSLKSLRDEIETNDRLLEDYPEVCYPVRALEGTQNRAHYQRANGFRFDTGKPFETAQTKFSWCGDELVLPNVPGSPSAKSIIATRGLDSEVRGVNKGNLRPQLAVIDDPDTEETVRSGEQAKKLEERIDRGIGGLGDQRRSVARVLITTLQRRDCVSAWYTDVTRKPSFKGKRFRFLLKPPDRADMWDEYCQMWQADKQFKDDAGNYTDEFSRRAHRFFLDNRKVMESGAVIANPNRFEPTILPDGSQLEISALQSYYNFVAKNGQEAASAELDNDPSEEAGIMESGLTAQRIQKQVSGFPRNIVPEGCNVIVQAIDCGKIMLHWVVRAFRSDATGFTIDYGINPVHDTKVNSDEGLELALVLAIKQRFAELEENPYLDPDGHIVPVQLTLVDAHYRDRAIYEACRQIGKGILPAMGFGKSAGCIQANFDPNQKSVPGKKHVGDHWVLKEIEDGPGVGLWRVHMDTDSWKAWEHDRWMTDPSRPGAMLLWGESSRGDTRLSKDEFDHMRYAQQIVSEVEVEEVHKGALRRRWDVKNKKNHWLDASYMADVAASIKGIRLLRQQVAAKKKPKQESPPQIESAYSDGNTPFLASLRG